MEVITKDVKQVQCISQQYFVLNALYDSDVLGNHQVLYQRRQLCGDTYIIIGVESNPCINIQINSFNILLLIFTSFPQAQRLQSKVKFTL
jgi:hypothetical protein